eukprot:2337524-Rhodomonas_salina.1
MALPSIATVILTRVCRATRWLLATGAAAPLIVRIPGNNHDLMFLKQWLAASEVASDRSSRAGAKKMLYHDFDRKQSHSIFGLVRRMKEMTVGQLWRLLQ